MRFVLFFSNFSRKISSLTGQPKAFVIACLLVLIWFVTGPLFDFSDTWQLVINTGTTIITFLMVFLIQNTQNRDSRAVQIKLDELIRAQEGTHNALLDLEELTEDQLLEINEKYKVLAEKARERLSRGKNDTKVVDI